jgi:hypothetical protein
VVAIVRVTWLPPPSRMVWLAITSLGACALLAALVLIPSLRRYGSTIALVAGVACLVGSGTSTFRIVASAVAIALCVLGIALKNQWLPVAAAVLVTVLAVTHFEVFEHQLLAGWAPEVLQRVAITLALALAAAVVGSQLVIGLGATPAATPGVGQPDVGQSEVVEPVAVEP